MRKEIMDALINALTNSGNFKKVLNGVLPPVPNVKSFPTIAVVVDEENRNRVEVTSCVFQSTLKITAMIYAKASSTKYTDVLSDLIESVEQTIQQDETLNTLVLDIYVDKIQQDGGILYPYQLAELTIIAYYRQNT